MKITVYAKQLHQAICGVRMFELQEFGSRIRLRLGRPCQTGQRYWHGILALMILIYPMEREFSWNGNTGCSASGENDLCCRIIFGVSHLFFICTKCFDVVVDYFSFINK